MSIFASSLIGDTYIFLLLKDGFFAFSIMKKRGHKNFSVFEKEMLFAYSKLNLLRK